MMSVIKGVFVGLVDDKRVYVCDMTKVGLKSMNVSKDNPIDDHWEKSKDITKKELIAKLTKEYFE